MQKGTRASIIYEALQRSIVEGALLPGDPLVEAELSETFKVSRTPIREALRRLQNDGLVEVTPYSVARVARVSPSDVLAAFDARIWLEPPVFSLAAERGTDSFIESLRTLTNKMPEEPTTRAAALQALEADFAFHRAVFASIGNRYVSNLLDEALSVTRRAVNLSPPPRFTQAREEHLEIMAAFEAKDGGRAAFLVHMHLTNARKRYSGGYGE